MTHRVIKPHVIRTSHNEMSILELRNLYGMTQAGFGKLLGVTVDTIQAWENVRKSPSSMSKRLLFLLATNPEVVFSLLSKYTD